MRFVHPEDTRDDDPRPLPPWKARTVEFLDELGSQEIGRWARSWLEHALVSDEHRRACPSLDPHHDHCRQVGLGHLRPVGTVLRRREWRP